jgi:hypothetical protein
MAPSILDPIICIVLGILAVPNLIIAKRPDAKQLIDKLAPFQGYIGAVAALWGVWRVITVVLNLSIFIALLTMKAGVMGMVFAILYILYALLSVGLGLMLGIGVLKTWIKNPQAQAKMDQTLAKLAPKQGSLGVLALIVGAAMLVMVFIH